jgi:hypothetical protein
MGLFKPKITEAQKTQIALYLKQVRESAHLVNTTIKPDVFFGRLKFLLETLNILKTFEKYRVFKGATPTAEYNEIISNLGLTVHEFIDRSLKRTLDDVEKLKTDKARQNRLEKYFETMLGAFDRCHTFWLGDKRTYQSHLNYMGELYTQNNLDYLHELESRWRAGEPLLLK